MGYRVTQATGSNNKTASQIELDLEGIPSSERKAAKEEIGQLIVEAVLSSVATAKSPVEGEEFPALSPDYKKFKKSKGLAGKPNMEFSGAMLDALTFKNTKDGIEVGFFNKEAAKADGHLNFSGDSSLPQRRFLPGEGEEFKADISKQIDRILADHSKKPTKDDFEDVESSKDLYGVLGDLFGDLSRTELRLAVLRNDDLLELLDDLGLMDLL